MKKTIGGLRYDTDKAIKIGSYRFGDYPQSGNFSHWWATLYKTPRSERYFLHGAGGVMTRFGQYGSDGLRCGGEKIIPLDSGEAIGWAGQHLDEITVEQHFGVRVEWSGRGHWLRKPGMAEYSQGPQTSK